MTDSEQFATLFATAQSHFEAGLYQQAFAEYQQVLAFLQPSTPPRAEDRELVHACALIYMYCGDCLLEMGDKTAALEWYFRSANSYETNGLLDDAYLVLCNKVGVLYLEQETHNEAIVWFDKAVTRSEGHAPPAERLVWLNNLASVYYELGDLRSAYPPCAQAATLVLEHKVQTQQAVIALKNFGTLCRELGQCVQSLQFLQGAHQMAEYLRLSTAEIQDIEEEIAETMLAARQRQ